MNPKLPNIYADPGPQLTVALCQVYTEPWDLGGNLTRTLEALAEAKRQGADLAITPECVFHGYGFGRDQKETLERYAQVAEPLDGPRLAAVRAAARARRLRGRRFLHSGAAGVFHNAAAFHLARRRDRRCLSQVSLRTF